MNTMNWAEAKAAMQSGKRVTHNVWDAGEYLHMVEDRVYDENDILVQDPEWYGTQDHYSNGFVVYEFDEDNIESYTFAQLKGMAMQWEAHNKCSAPFTLSQIEQELDRRRGKEEVDTDEW